MGIYTRAGSSPALGTKAIKRCRIYLIGSAPYIVKDIWALSSVWLERLFDVQKVRGSTPLEPTKSEFAPIFFMEAIKLWKK